MFALPIAIRRIGTITHRHRQESEQAVRNYLLPPVSEGGGCAILTVHCKLTRYDRIEAYRIGLPRLSLTRCFFHILLLGAAVFILWLIGRTDGFQSAWPPRGPFHWPALKNVILPAVIGLAGGLLPSLPILRATVTQIVQITPNHLLVKTPLGLNRCRWRKVIDTYVNDQYVCFCLGQPAAVLVPLAAFKSQEQAGAFAEQAELYWRRATGQEEPPPLNPAVVWPPAPMIAPVQEPNRRP